ncbi:hypothetical protein TcasGA2_TC032043 [Tribolium castaneum]|uniref:Uncharacterized protein n=1 Tax=Tribolium castaneum TaxID=7070 RepID=A0A139WMG3_TRICA|nr:hypothetical protein TcasGA2_TC032043 [Tribolium castaneum]
MTQYFHSIFNLRIGWFILVVINFIFGICGIITCTLKLKHGSEQARDDFFKLSIVFATCNLILSVLLLVSVIKNNQKYAFLCAFLSFLSLFSALLEPYFCSGFAFMRRIRFFTNANKKWNRLTCPLFEPPVYYNN